MCTLNTQNRALGQGFGSFVRASVQLAARNSLTGP